MAEFNNNELVVGTAPASETSFEWLHESILRKTGQTPSEIRLEDFSGMGGLSGAAMRRLIVTFSDGTKRTFVYKTILPAGQSRSKDLGLPREAFFYEHLAPTLAMRGVPMPSVIFVHGNMNTGEKTIILEDLSSSCVQSGYFFGPGSPLNWGKDLNALIAANRPAGNIQQQNFSMEKIAQAAFRRAASLHATYWMDRGLLQHKWLRSQGWLQGQNEDSWQASQKTVLEFWAKAMEKRQAGTSTVQWDTHLLQCMEASFAKISWTDYQQMVQNAEYQWTLVHGDFHPANIMWRWVQEQQEGGSNTTEAVEAGGSPVILDFEVVGLGSGAQDLAQYLISHMEPQQRRACEEALLADYYAHLTGTAGVEGAPAVPPTQYSYAQCQQDYVQGGVGRWVWMLGLLAGMCPDNMTQYFHDQLRHFIADHGVTPASMPMPRV